MAGRHVSFLLNRESLARDRNRPVARGGAGVGVVAGGLVGLLIGMGASRAEAEYFDQGVRAAGMLVTVQPGPARVAEARSILQAVGADLGPSAGPSGAPAAGVRGDEENEPWRGNERRYRQDASFGGPER